MGWSASRMIWQCNFQKLRKGAFGRFFCSLRQRKDRGNFKEYSGVKMSALLPTSMTTVEEVLRALPEAGQIFIKHHTDCVGCRLARFCTLAEVAEVYEIHLLS